jgi:hypothetical protein
MNTPAVPPALSPQPTRVNQLWDRLFFGGMAILLTGSVLLGFRTYFLGWYSSRTFAKQDDPRAWGRLFFVVVLFMLQTFLVPAGRVHWHRQLGLRFHPKYQVA